MKTGILWVSYSRDIEFFRMSARSYKKFAKNFDFAKVVVPIQDLPAFKEIAEPCEISVYGFDEWPGKGQLHQQAIKCNADVHLPNADVIFHMDSDCVFWKETIPEEFLPGWKPLMPFIDFTELLTRPVEPDEMMTFMGFTGKRIDFNRGQYFWKFAAEYALGFPVERETMTWMPIIHKREVYKKTRDIVKERFGNFERYIQGCRNAFPQTFCEFNTLGGVAYRFFNEEYHWHNLKQGYPFVPAIQCYSHGGFDRPHEFPMEIGGHQTPRDVFVRLGLL